MKRCNWKGVVLGTIAFSLIGCGDSSDEPSDAEARSSALSPSTTRVIVKYANARGPAAVAAAGGTVALELPLVDGAAVELPEAAVEALRNAPGIDYVEPDYRRYPSGQTTPYGIDMVLEPLDPASGTLDPPLLPGGTGRTTVCIIDSGYDLEHPDLPQPPLVTGSNDSGSGLWYSDENSHGTHVAGTIAAVNNDLGVVGVGPDAIALHIVKVFDADGWAYSSTLIDAAQDCADNQARVISMSLGGSFKSRSEDRAFATLYDQGILSIAAAGNDGNTRKSYPASYDSVMSVAAIDSAKNIASFSQQNAAVEIAAPGVHVLSTVPYLDATTVTLADASTVDSSRLEFAADGLGAGALAHGGLCDSVGSHSGEVVLCDRGSISFFDKVANAEAGGAVAVLIANNEPGNFSGTLGSADNGTTIPAVSISQEDGTELKANHLGTTVTVEAVSDPNGHGYAYFDGTSMATPHVSAVAALIWSHDSSWTAAEIREALTATAEDLGPAGLDNAYGHGLVQAEAALAYLRAEPPPACTVTEDPEVSCDDGLDNDCDGLIDAADDSCSTGGGGGGGTCELGAIGDRCSSAAECCSNKCKGKPGGETCK